MKLNKTMNNSICPLCKSNKTSIFSKDKKREYNKCKICTTIFVIPSYYMSEEDEIKRYSKHTNSINDDNYIKFLSRITDPIKKRVEKNDIGLDFGCGPGPILKCILKEYQILEFDPYFKNDINIYSKKWNYVISTEVIEHLKNPYKVIEKIWNTITNNGYLFLMTQLYNNEIEFKSWYYKGDPTHIVFFTKDSFKWLGNKLDAEVKFIDKDIIILKKT